MDKAFADCSIPQEKSNAEINAELELSDASGEEDASGTLVNYEQLECQRPKGIVCPHLSQAEVCMHVYIFTGRHAWYLFWHIFLWVFQI